MRPFRVQKAEGKTDVGPAQAKMVTGAMSNLLVGGMCACRCGRIAIANSDAAASAVFEAAMEQGHRAVLDLNQF